MADIDSGCHGTSPSYRALLAGWPYAAELGHNYQRADHAGFAVAGDAAIEGIGARRAWCEERQAGCTCRQQRVDSELVDVEAVGVRVLVLQPEGDCLAHL